MLTINKTVNYKGGFSTTSGTVVKFRIAMEREELPKRYVAYELFVFRSEADMLAGEDPVTAKTIKNLYEEVEVADQATYEALTPQKLHEIVRDEILVDNPTWVAGDFVIDLTK